MSTTELFILAVSLSMDAFAASICKGLSAERMKPEHMLITGLYFGGFQALMPLIGYLLGKQFESLIMNVDHWIAFALLSLIGLNMIKEARGPAKRLNPAFTPKVMLPLAVATSIDALAVGVTLAVLRVDIIPAVCFIGIITFFLSAAGVKVGDIIGAKYKSHAEIVGGVTLIGVGAKILLEHLGLIG